MIINIFPIGLVYWPITEAGKTCENPEEVHLDKVTLVTCQDACLKQNDCLGISCSFNEYGVYDFSGSCFLISNIQIFIRFSEVDYQIIM